MQNNKSKEQSYTIPKQVALKVCMMLSLCLLLMNSYTFGQTAESVTIPKSTKSQVISGVKYILHTVAKGQTLYAISKAYGR